MVLLDRSYLITVVVSIFRVIRMFDLLLTTSYYIATFYLANVGVYHFVKDNIFSAAISTMYILFLSPL